jgi:hypothetical protein
VPEPLRLRNAVVAVDDDTGRSHEGLQLRFLLVELGPPGT